MSSAFVSPQFIDLEEVLKQNMGLIKPHQHTMCAERRNVTNIGSPVNIQRNRNFSIGNFTVNGNSLTSVIPMDNQSGLNEHRKLDRSYSEPCDRTLNNNTNLNVQQINNTTQVQQQQPAVNSSRYKTELCRPFEESGHCKYADKCQFAHGAHELKQLQRHPKYKTELCRTFHSKGFCPYGPRCNFIHNDDMGKVNDKNNRVSAQTTVQQHQQQNTQYFQHISPPGLSQSPPPMVQRPTSINFNSSFTGSMGSSADSSPPSSVGSESPSLSPVFFGDENNQLMNSGYLPTNNTLNFDSSTNCNVFNLTPELAPFDLAPLKIQTQVSDLGLITQNFSSILNLNNRSNNNEKVSAFDDWENYTTQQPPSSPDSISGESNASASSFGTNNTVSSCGSPMDSGKNFRLPVFNHISQD